MQPDKQVNKAGAVLAERVATKAFMKSVLNPETQHVAAKPDAHMNEKTEEEKKVANNYSFAD